VQEFERLHARTFEHRLCPLYKEEPANSNLCLRQRRPETGMLRGGPTEQRG